jgi:iron complex transport system substrate-binding protein
MYKLKLVIPIFLTLLLFSCGSEEKKSQVSSIIIKDDLNNKITLSSVPERVICLAPNMTEMIFAIGEGNKLVGNTLYGNYPEAAKKITKVGDMLSINYEQILDLKPDLIFLTVEGNSKDSYEKLMKLGFKVFVSNSRNYEGIKKTLTDLGKIFGKELKAESILKEWDGRYNDVEEQVKKYPRKTAMFLIGLNPIMLAGKNTFINGLMTADGLINIASDSPLNYPIYSREEILKKNPDYILMTGSSDKDYKQLTEAYKEWKFLKAVKNGNVIVLDPDLYLRPGPRFIDALENLFILIFCNVNSCTHIPIKFPRLFTIVMLF